MTSKRLHGFTLIELVFVVFLIAMVSSVTLPRLASMTGINLRTGSTEVAGYLRNAYERSVMSHERIRVRFDLVRGTYWAETYEEPAPLPLLDENTKLEEAFDNFEDELEKTPLSPEEKLALVEERFKKVEVGNLRPQKLPHGLKFKGVYTATAEQVVEQGSPWVEFSPGGYATMAVVYVMNNSENIYSVILPSLTGRSRVERGEVRPEDA